MLHRVGQRQGSRRRGCGGPLPPIPPPPTRPRRFAVTDTGRGHSRSGEAIEAGMESELIDVKSNVSDTYGVGSP